MQRVLVIGSPGSGKSTLATELARRTRLPLIHLDQEWRSGWVEPPKDEWRKRVAQLVAGKRWIIDGNYGGTLDVRLARADTVIDLEFPPWLCVRRILRRVLRSRGRVRPDMAQGCPEQLNLRFLCTRRRSPSPPASAAMPSSSASPASTSISPARPKSGSSWQVSIRTAKSLPSFSVIASDSEAIQ